ncbi:MAG: hypothetical protein KJ718_02490 [Nanoarchaeota archaeon]|nr:hypothetical protein [Nanoarchaeota archaeon]
MENEIKVGWIISVIVVLLFFGFLIYGAFVFGVNLGMALYISFYGPIALGLIIVTWIVVWILRAIRKNEGKVR